MAQAFFEHAQHALLVASFGVDHPVRVQPGASHGWREQVPLTQAPEHRPRHTGENAGHKQHRRGAVDRALAASGHLVQRSELKPSARQTRVQRRHAKGQHGGL